MSQVGQFLSSFSGGIVTLNGDAGSATGGIVTIAGGTGISTVAGGATVTINLNSPVAIVNGGTNATSMANTDGVVYYDGTRLVTTTVGTAGYVLTSNGPGMAPTFQVGGGAGTVTSIIGTANQITASSPTGNVTLSIPATFIAPGSIASTTSVTVGNALTVTAGNTTLTPLNASGIVFNSAAGLLSTSATTNNAVQVGNATGQLTSLAVGANGSVLIGATGANPAFALLTSASGTITFTTGINTLNLEAAPIVNTYTSVNNAASPYTVLATDEYISVDTSGGAVTLRFPNAPVANRIWTVKDRLGNAATNNITVTTGGGIVDIDGAAIYTMNVNYQAINLIWNGASYEVY
jgi:hypothetical protein